MTEAERLLKRVADAAPTKRGSYSHSAQIPWSLIIEIREWFAAREAEH